MAFIDYYKILGVSKDIPQKDVRADPDKRAKYDKYGEQWRNADAYEKAGGFGGYGGAGSSGGNPFEGFDFGSFGKGGFSSFFQDLFGGGKRGGFSSGFQDFGGASVRHSTGEMNASVNIDLYTALLGGEVIIQLSDGKKIKLKIKPETQNGTKVRLRGKGYDRGDGTFGDLIITYNVKLPTNLTARQQELLRQMRDER